jgi:hypothetical protein
LSFDPIPQFQPTTHFLLHQVKFEDAILFYLLHFRHFLNVCISFQILQHRKSEEDRRGAAEAEDQYHGNEEFEKSWFLMKEMEYRMTKKLGMLTVNIDM